ncbi:hypothetical protein HDV05_003123, partial [Chytridiales sp. JEL 0842]
MTSTVDHELSPLPSSLSQPVIPYDTKLPQDIHDDPIAIELLNALKSSHEDPTKQSTDTLVLESEPLQAKAKSDLVESTTPPKYPPPVKRGHRQSGSLSTLEEGTCKEFARLFEDVESSSTSKQEDSKGKETGKSKTIKKRGLIS